MVRNVRSSSATVDTGERQVADLAAGTLEQTSLVALNAAGWKAPLFCVHAAAGHLRLYENLVRYLPVDQPVYGLRAFAGRDWCEANVQFEAVARRYACEIRQAVPSGPYIIVGECTGGALAYELAQQLRAMGADVPVLALIDAFAPGQPRLRRNVPRRTYRAIHRVQMLGAHLANLQRLDARERCHYVGDRATRIMGRMAGRRSADHRPATAQAIAERRFLEAFRAYEPTPYGGDAVLFRATRLPWGIERTEHLGWGAFAGKLQIETVPSYFTMTMSEPRVRTLAVRLARRLATADRDTNSTGSQYVLTPSGPAG